MPVLVLACSDWLRKDTGDVRCSAAFMNFMIFMIFMIYMIFVFLKDFINSEVCTFSNMIVIIIISTALAYVDLNAEPVSTCSQAGA